MKKLIGDRLFQLSQNDLVKGAFIAFLGVLAKAIQTMVDTNAFPATWAEWYAILMVGGKVAVLYIVKNLLTNSKGEILKKEEEPKA